MLHQKAVKIKQKSNKSRLTWIDNLRALCILEIICINHMGHYASVDFSAEVFVKITEGVLAIFTFLSGYCLSRYSFKTFADVKNFLCKRLVRFWPLFAVATVTLALITWKDYIEGPKQLILTLTGLSSFCMPNKSAIWYMAMIMVFYAVHPFIFYKESKFKVLLKAGIVLFVFCIAYFALGGEIRMIIYYPVYICGIYIGKHKECKILKRNWIISVAILLLSALTIYLSMLADTAKGNIIGFSIAALARIVMEFCICFLGCQAIQYLPKCFDGFLKPISFASMCMFLFHTQYYSLLCYKLGVLSAWMAYLVFLPILVVICYFIQKGYDAVCAKIIRR